MMRRLARIDAPQALVREIFRDVEAWPRWMPGVTACRVLEHGPDRLRIQLSQSALGRIWKQTVEIRFDGDSMRIRALDGALLWCVVWKCQKPPNGDGTTVSMALDSGRGLFGGRLFEKINDRRFDKAITAVAEQARRLSSRETEAEGAEERVLLTVYETAEGFEVWYEGRRYVTR